MREERLNNLVLLSIERDISETLNLDKKDIFSSVVRDGYSFCPANNVCLFISSSCGGNVDMSFVESVQWRHLMLPSRLSKSHAYTLTIYVCA